MARLNLTQSAPNHSRKKTKQKHCFSFAEPRNAFAERKGSVEPCLRTTGLEFCKNLQHMLNFFGQNFFFQVEFQCIVLILIPHMRCVIVSKMIESIWYYTLY